MANKNMISGRDNKKSAEKLKREKAKFNEEVAEEAAVSDSKKRKHGKGFPKNQKK